MYPFDSRTTFCSLSAEIALAPTAGWGASPFDELLPEAVAEAGDSIFGGAATYATYANQPVTGSRIPHSNQGSFAERGASAMGGIRRACTRSLNLAARSFGVDERATAAASGRSSSTFKTGVSDCFLRNPADHEWVETA
jgi:hypothetical protein